MVQCRAALNRARRARNRTPPGEHGQRTDGGSLLLPAIKTCKRFMVLQLDPVHVFYVDVEWRVVHGDVDVAWG